VLPTTGDQFAWIAEVRAEQLEKCASVAAGGDRSNGRPEIVSAWETARPRSMCLNSTRHFAALCHQDSEPKSFAQHFGKTKAPHEVVDELIGTARHQRYEYSGFEDAPSLVWMGGRWEAPRFGVAALGSRKRLTIHFPGSLG